MTPLMMLALTLPPSLAFVIERILAGREAQARSLAENEAEKISILWRVQDDQSARLAAGQQRFSEHEAELKRLAEQVSLLADRYR